MKTFVQWLEQLEDPKVQAFANDVANRISAAKTRKLGATPNATPPDGDANAKAIIQRATLNAAANPKNVQGAIDTVSKMKKK